MRHQAINERGIVMPGLADLGEKFPAHYLKGFYNNARDLLEVGAPEFERSENRRRLCLLSELSEACGA